MNVFTPIPLSVVRGLGTITSAVFVYHQWLGMTAQPREGIISPASHRHAKVVSSMNFFLSGRIPDLGALCFCIFSVLNPPLQEWRACIQCCR